MGRHVALDEQGAACRIKTGRQQQAGRLACLAAEILGIDGQRQGMEVHDAEIGVAAILNCHPGAHRAEVVPEVHRS